MNTMNANIVNENQRTYLDRNQKKKGWKVVFIWFLPYGRFLSNSIVIKAPTTMIATNKPVIAGTKYWSATDCTGIGVGVGVGAASSTVNDVSA